MKHVVKSLVMTGAILASGGAFAEMADICPYIGLDYYHTWMQGKNLSSTEQFGSLFPKSYPGASLYAGARFLENFGAELGLDWSAKRKRRGLVADDTIEVNIRRRGAHVDLLGFLPVADCFDLIGSVGLGVVKAKIGVGMVNQVGAVDRDTPVSTKSAAVLRLGIGASYMLTDMVGLRTKLGFENTRRIKLKEVDSDTVKPFRNTTSLSAGVFVRF